MYLWEINKCKDFKVPLHFEVQLSPQNTGQKERVHGSDENDYHDQENENDSFEDSECTRISHGFNLFFH